MSQHYAAFGLHLAANGPIPGLPPTEPDSPVDVHVSLDGRPLKTRSHRHEVLLYESSVDPEGLRLRVWESSGYFRFHYSDGAEFLVNRRATRIEAAWAPPLSVEDMATYLLGPMLGFVLRRRGVVCLHAASIAVGEAAIALVGPGGAGKSTVAAAFAKSGFPILHDDIAAITERGGALSVLPGYPRLRLWPASVNTLYGSPDALPHITPGNPAWDKRYLDLGRDHHRFQASPLRLRAIYLGHPSPDTSGPTVGALPRSEGLLRLVANSYGGYLLDAEQRAHEFEVLGRLATELPLREIRSRNGLSELRRLFDTVLEDVGNVCGEIVHPPVQVLDGTLSQ